MTYRDSLIGNEIANTLRKGDTNMKRINVDARDGEATVSYSIMVPETTDIIICGQAPTPEFMNCLWLGYKQHSQNAARLMLKAGYDGESAAAVMLNWTPESENPRLSGMQKKMMADRIKVALEIRTLQGIITKTPDIAIHIQPRIDDLVAALKQMVMPTFREMENALSQNTKEDTM